VEVRVRFTAVAFLFSPLPFDFSDFFYFIFFMLSRVDIYSQGKIVCFSFELKQLHLPVLTKRCGL
jgi:hypothetical protein